MLLTSSAAASPSWYSVIRRTLLISIQKTRDDFLRISSNDKQIGELNQKPIAHHSSHENVQLNN